MIDETPAAGPMDAARFRRLCDAYGGRIGRWPAEAREAAATFAETAEGHPLITAARRLDTMLDRYHVERPASALEARILAATRPAASLRATLRSRWAGFGLVGVGLAGALTGAFAVALVLAGPMANNSFAGDRMQVGSDRTATIFGDIGEGQRDLGGTTQ